VKFHSILFRKPADESSVRILTEPACFRDLNFDQVVSDIEAACPDHLLAPFFYLPLKNFESISYRQEIMRELEESDKFRAIQDFTGEMRRMRERLAASAKSYYRYEKAALFLTAAATYCSAVGALLNELDTATPRAEGLRGFRDFLSAYAQSSSFVELRARVRNLRNDLQSIRYTFLIRDSSVTVRDLSGELDYAAIIDESFFNFRGARTTTSFEHIAGTSGMNPVEAEILERVALLHPQTFAGLLSFCAEWTAYADAQIVRFDHEIQFYLGYLEHIAPLRRAGLKFCYPQFAGDGEAIEGYEAFDLALASELIERRTTVTCNDMVLRPPERILVVSGANQGGKTTFARMVGQLHVLACLGCPVPGSRASLVLCDQVFTHFERREIFFEIRGRLQDDLVRIRQLLLEATSRSVVILNELFVSTTVDDAIYLSGRIMHSLCELNAVGVWVTFLQELAASSNKTVSVVAEVDALDPAVRTFKLVRKPPDGLAHSFALTAKHRVTYEDLRLRFQK
jgi:DNA mismatch repair protein MutS